MTIRYEYPVGGEYNQTVAILEDGRRMWINTQYATADVRHADDCAKMVARRSKINICESYAAERAAACTCGALDGIDTEALIADARINGKRGTPPKAPIADAHEASVEHHGHGLCPKCESYCCGDCEAA